MKAKSNRGIAILMYLPFFLCFVFLWIVPFVYGIYMSVHQYSLFAGNNGFLGLKNFTALMDSNTVFGTRFFNSLTNTLIFVGISVPSLVIFSLLLALLVNKLKGKWKVIVRTIFFISYSISVTAVSSIFLWFFNGNGGFINNLLNSLGMSGVGWLNDQPYAWITILITTVWWTIGYNMILFINALDDIDYALYEAASIDGASSWQTFWSITFPSIQDVLTFIIVTTITASFNLYGQALLITAGGPQQSTTSLIMVIQQIIFDQSNLGVGSAMALVMGFIMTCISALRYIRRGGAGSGI